MQSSTDTDDDCGDDDDAEEGCGADRAASFAVSAVRNAGIVTVAFLSTLSDNGSRACSMWAGVTTNDISSPIHDRSSSARLVVEACAGSEAATKG